MSNSIVPHTLDSFSGTFAISDHSKIHGILSEYLFEVFYDRVENKWIGGKRHILANISLDEINAALNEIWEGPGSVAKVVECTKISRENRRNGMIEKPLGLSNYKIPTIEDELEQED